MIYQKSWRKTVAELARENNDLRQFVISNIDVLWHLLGITKTLGPDPSTSVCLIEGEAGRSDKTTLRIVPRDELAGALSAEDVRRIPQAPAGHIPIFVRRGNARHAIILPMPPEVFPPVPAHALPLPPTTP